MWHLTRSLQLRLGHDDDDPEPGAAAHAPDRAGFQGGRVHGRYRWSRVAIRDEQRRHDRRYGREPDRALPAVARTEQAVEQVISLAAASTTQQDRIPKILIARNICDTQDPTACTHGLSIHCTSFHVHLPTVRDNPRTPPCSLCTCSLLVHPALSPR